MFSTITSAMISGVEPVFIHVEVDIAHGLPGFMLVGYLSGEVKEAGERVRVALKNTGIVLPPMRITVNLSPAGMRKEGTAFDRKSQSGKRSTAFGEKGKRRRIWALSASGGEL